jgi:membrane protease YdiL (CAAX protease family)
MDDVNQEPSEVLTEPLSPSPPLDLRFWLLVVGIGGIGSVLLQQSELAALITLAGLFAASHAADLSPAHRLLYRSVAWIVPLAGAAAFVGLAAFGKDDLTGTTRTLAFVFAGVGVLGSLAIAFTPLAAGLARRIFAVAEPSSTLRLAGRLALVAALLYPSATVTFPLILNQAEQTGGLVGKDSLWSNLIGMMVLALGGVGYRIRRDLRQTLERLGLLEVESRDWIVIGVGVVALVVLNAGAEWVQRAWLPGLWASDQRVNRMIAGGLSQWDTLLLGVSAGVGEELALRGALQPKLGVFLTSLVFALLHVQYSWFGVGIIFMLGLVLGTIRNRTSTTVAILVHALYDMFAVFTVTPN